MKNYVFSLLSVCKEYLDHQISLHSEIIFNVFDILYDTLCLLKCFILTFIYVNEKVNLHVDMDA